MQKDEEIRILKSRLQENSESSAESQCLRDVLGVMKNFMDRNDRKLFIDNVDSISKKYNLEGVFGNIQQIKEIPSVNN